MLNKILAQLLLMALLVGLQLLVMTQSWGLKPLNWWWIVGGGVFGHVALRALADKVNV